MLTSRWALIAACLLQDDGLLTTVLVASGVGHESASEDLCCAVRREQGQLMWCREVRIPDADDSGTRWTQRAWPPGECEPAVGGADELETRFGDKFAAVIILASFCFVSLPLGSSARRNTFCSKSPEAQQQNHEVFARNVQALLADFSLDFFVHDVRAECFVS